MCRVYDTLLRECLKTYFQLFCSILWQCFLETTKQCYFVSSICSDLWKWKSFVIKVQMKFSIQFAAIEEYHTAQSLKWYISICLMIVNYILPELHCAWTSFILCTNLIQCFWLYFNSTIDYWWVKAWFWSILTWIVTWVPYVTWTPKM